MLFVTFHGGKPKPGSPKLDPKRNNIHAYGKNGNQLSESVLNSSGGFVLSELRGLYLVGRYLYVVNANNTQNNVLCFQGSGINYELVGEFVSRKTCAAIVHPFDLTFDNEGYCFVSSQDTNVVTRFNVAHDGKTATAAATAPALPANGKFLPGTFVASNVSLEPPTTPVPLPGGLWYSDDGQKKHSVRGIVWANGALYVADQPACCIKVYDKDGRFLGQSNPAGTPVHLVVHEGKLFVSGDDHVRVAHLPNPPGDFKLSIIDNIKMKNTGAMTFSDGGNLFLASRTDNKILKFDKDFLLMDFECTVPDNPEFLLHL